MAVFGLKSLPSDSLVALVSSSSDSDTYYSRRSRGPSIDHPLLCELCGFFES